MSGMYKQTHDSHVKWLRASFCLGILISFLSVFRHPCPEVDCLPHYGSLVPQMKLGLRQKGVIQMANGQLGDCLTTQDPLEMHFCCPVNQLVVDSRGLNSTQGKTGARGLNELFLSHVVAEMGVRSQGTWLSPSNAVGEHCRSGIPSLTFRVPCRNSPCCEQSQTPLRNDCIFFPSFDDEGWQTCFLVTYSSSWWPQLFSVH